MNEEQTKKWVSRFVAESIAMGIIAKKKDYVKWSSVREKALERLINQYEELNPLPAFFKEG